MGFYKGYIGASIGITEKKMEATIMGLGYSGLGVKGFGGLGVEGFRGLGG